MTASTDIRGRTIVTHRCPGGRLGRLAPPLAALDGVWLPSEPARARIERVLPGADGPHCGHDHSRTIDRLWRERPAGGDQTFLLDHRVAVEPRLRHLLVGESRPALGGAPRYPEASESRVPA